MTFDWLDVAAGRIGLEHPVTVVLDETVGQRGCNGVYRGLRDGMHLVVLSPQVHDWNQISTVCHELVHCRQREVLGEERFDREVTSEFARVGNAIEGVHEWQAWTKGTELALTVAGPGFKVLPVPVLLPSHI